MECSYCNNTLVGDSPAFCAHCGKKVFYAKAEMLPLINRLQGAISNQEKIQIKYFGGSSPGARRDITPAKIEGAMLYAFCHKALDNRSFLLEKIEICESEITTKVSDTIKKVVDAANILSLEEFFHLYQEHITNKGWGIDYQPPHSLSLYSFLKNGKPRKSRDAYINFEEYAEKLICDIETGEIVEEYKKKDRPWAVYTPEKSANYATFQRAAEIFIKYIFDCSPVEPRKLTT